MFAYTAERGRVRVAFTDRHGGVSRGPYASLNLSAGGDGDDPEAVAENGRRVVRAMSGSEKTRLVGMRQVHGDAVVLLTDPDAPASEGDALVTTLPGVLLAVRAADCVPLVLADPEAGVVAAVHVGRAGMLNSVAVRALETMRECGARDVVGWLGPHICGRCYEVPAEMSQRAATVVPQAAASTSWGTPALDIGAGVAAQLRGGGVEVAAVGLCTRETPALYSYRRDGGVTGRHAGLVQVRP